MNQGLTDQEFDKLARPNSDIESEKVRAKENLIESYRNIIDILKEYLDLDESHYNIIALWVIGTYFHDRFLSYPFLYFNAMKGSGKTRTMNLITALAKNGEMLNSLTEATLFRTKGTLAIDEFEGVGKRGKENLRELLNSAYKKGIKVKRMKQQKTDKGTEQVVEEFEVYRPIVIANIWGMENVLGDRCIQLVLEKSDRREITNLIEIFREEEIVTKTKLLLSDLVTLVTNDVSFKTYKKWNSFIKNNITNNTNNTNNTNVTNVTTSPPQLFKTLKLMDLNGRELELSLPLMIIADMISQKILKETSLTLKSIFQEKKEQDITENLDVSLFDFVSQIPSEKWESTRDLLREFKGFIDSNDDWINSKWLGRSLKRLNLIKSKRKMGRGRQYILDLKKAQEKMRMFK